MGCSFGFFWFLIFFVGCFGRYRVMVRERLEKVVGCVFIFIWDCWFNLGFFCELIWFVVGIFEGRVVFFCVVFR